MNAGRDLRLAGLLKDSAQSHSLTVIDVDGTRTLDQTAAVVEGHFGPYLQDLAGRKV